MDHNEYRAIRAMLADFGETAEPVSEAIAVYGIDGNLKSPDFLQTARQIGWRYVLQDGNGTHKYLNVSVDKQSFLSLNTPFKPAALVEGLRAAGNQGLLTPATDLRILEIPTVKMSALWMREAGKDSFLPYMSGVQPTSMTVDNGFVWKVNREAAIVEQRYRGGAPGLGG
jgi:hypothetical protein